MAWHAYAASLEAYKIRYSARSTIFLIKRIFYHRKVIWVIGWQIFNLILGVNALGLPSSFS